MREMSANAITKKIDDVIKKHKDDNVSPFDTNFVEILTYLKDYIWDMQKEIDDLTKELKMTNDMQEYERKEKEEREIDISAFEEMSAMRDERAYNNDTKEVLSAFIRNIG